VENLDFPLGGGVFPAIGKSCGVFVFCGFPVEEKSLIRGRKRLFRIFREKRIFSTPFPQAKRKTFSTVGKKGTFRRRVFQASGFFISTAD